MKRIFESPWLATRLEVILGALFIYASIHKIADPPDFAKFVYNFKVTPCALINLVAIYLPWVELVAGAALILGIRGKRGAAAIVGALLVVFIAGIAVNLIRGNAIECGCFAGSGPPKTREQLIADMWWDIGRDLVMLLMAAQILWASRAAAGKAVATQAAT